MIEHLGGSAGRRTIYASWWSLWTWQEHSHEHVKSTHVPPIDSKLVTVMQWLSPAFPIGGFAYSHGLEWAINKGYVSNREELQKWISDLLEYGSLKNDAILIKLVLQGSDPKEINELAMALCPASERLSETQIQGGAFCKIMREVWSLEIDDLTLPIALALAAKMKVSIRI